jgi:hypothetical protein
MVILGPGRVIVSYTPCDCAGARQAAHSRRNRSPGREVNRLTASGVLVLDVLRTATEGAKHGTPCRHV